MKFFRLFSLFNGLILSSNICATTLVTPMLSPKVNSMAMDYGLAYGGDIGAYAIQATINLHQFLQEMYPEKIPQVLWQFIEVTPMIGVKEPVRNNFDKMKINGFLI